MSKYGFSGKYFSFGGSVKDEPSIVIRVEPLSETAKKINVLLSQALSQMLDAQLKQAFSIGSPVHIPHIPNVHIIDGKLECNSYSSDPSLHTALRYRDPVSEVL